jgi:alpha-beta hydrolase superfamily lysophospholipase
MQVDAQKRQYFEVPNDYDDEEPYRIYQHLIDDGAQYSLLDNQIALSMPVRMLHGIDDDVVEWQRSVRVMQKLASDDVHLRLLKGRDHRLSEPEDLNLICHELEALLHRV